MSRNDDNVRTTQLMHEIILALTGIDTLFTARDPLIPNYNRALLEPSEAELLERILVFGRNYGEIQDFVCAVNDQKFRNERVGLYLTTFVEAVDAATRPYWKTLVSLEQDIVKPRGCSLQYVWSKIYKHSNVLAGLKKIVNDVNNKELRGCLLVQYIQNETGICVDYANYVKPILKSLNRVFYHQIFCWMVHGQLIDPYNEFFIKENPSSNSSDTPFKRFSVNLEMLPLFVTPRFATRILEVGQTVLFLRSNPRMPYHEEKIDPRAEVCIIGDELMKRRDKKIQNKIYDMEEVTVWNEKNIMTNFVAQISACVNKELWNLAHNDAKIIDQLRLVKEFFLLGRGELFHEFMVQVEHNFQRGLAGSNESTVDSDLNSILQEAVQKIHIKEDFLQRFKLEYKKSGDEEKPMSLGGEWSNVTVIYDIPWPLELLFTPSVLRSYNRIFQFLLRLKKIQVKFVNCWLNEKTNKSKNNNRRRVLHRNLWFLINNLQYYLHADVLESQFEIFQAAVKSSKNFDEIERAHTIFVENLVSQLFLFKEVGSTSAKTAINRNLNRIMKICEEYFHEVDVHEDGKIEDIKIKSMLLRFESCVECLLKRLSKYSNEDTYPGNQYLAQFLLRLDYNSFFVQQIKSDTNMLYV